MTATPRRRCLAEGCTAQVPPRLWGCLRHWRMVPPPLRRAIWAAYRPGQEVDLHTTAAYREASRAAATASAAAEGRR